MVTEDKRGGDGINEELGINIYTLCVCVHALSQSCLTLCTCMVCSPLGFSVHGVSQARKTRIPEWVAISFSGDLRESGIKPVSHEFFTIEPPERPKINYTPVEKKNYEEKKKA